jgi:hypothetical protein
MQQRQLRLGDILDDYCPRERRLTNHAVVAMVGADVKQTRCTTCDAEHEYKHAKVPRQRKKTDAAALQAPVVAGAPKKVPHAAETAPEPPNAAPPEPVAAAEPAAAPPDGDMRASDDAKPDDPVTDEELREDPDADEDTQPVEEGPVHRPLIRAQLPRAEGQPPATRPGPDFTIRQPGGGRPNRFRPRHQRGGGGPFQGNRAGGNFAGGGQMRGGQRQGGGRPPMMSRNAKRQQGAGGRKRSK